MSTKRYLPASGTAGLARSFVKGNSRVPAPPPMMMARVSSVGVFRFITCYRGRASYWLNYYCPMIRLFISSLTPPSRALVSVREHYTTLSGRYTQPLAYPSLPLSRRRSRYSDTIHTNPNQIRCPEIKLLGKLPFSVRNFRVTFNLSVGVAVIARNIVIPSRHMGTHGLSRRGAGDQGGRRCSRWPSRQPRFPSSRKSVRLELEVYKDQS
jgi:hypothetical protein